MPYSPHAAEQISRLPSADPALTEWAIDLGDGRTGRVRVPASVYDAVEATDQDAYVREALADHLNEQRIPDEVLLTGDHVVPQL